MHSAEGTGISFKTAGMLLGYARGQGGGLQWLLSHERCRRMGPTCTEGEAVDY
jgi:hypothetical protein